MATLTMLGGPELYGILGDDDADMELRDQPGAEHHSRYPSFDPSSSVDSPTGVHLELAPGVHPLVPSTPPSTTLDAFEVNSIRSRRSDGDDGIHYEISTSDIRVSEVSADPTETSWHDPVAEGYQIHTQRELAVPMSKSDEYPKKHHPSVVSPAPTPTPTQNVGPKLSETVKRVAPAVVAQPRARSPVPARIPESVPGQAVTPLLLAPVVPNEVPKDEQSPMEAIKEPEVVASGTAQHRRGRSPLTRRAPLASRRVSIKKDDAPITFFDLKSPSFEKLRLVDDRSPSPTPAMPTLSFPPPPPRNASPTPSVHRPYLADYSRHLRKRSGYTRRVSPPPAPMDDDVDKLSIVGQDLDSFSLPSTSGHILDTSPTPHLKQGRYPITMGPDTVSPVPGGPPSIHERHVRRPYMQVEKPLDERSIISPLNLEPHVAEAPAARRPTSQATLRPSPEPAAGIPDEWICPLQLTLEELFKGDKYTFRIITRMLNGTPKVSDIDIDIQPGWERGTQIVFPGAGNERRPGVFQDTIFVVEQVHHERFSRLDGGRLMLNQDIDLVDALREGVRRPQMDVVGIDGNALAFYPPTGVIRPKHETVIKGQGMWIRSEGKAVGRGDLIIKWNIREEDTVSGRNDPKTSSAMQTLFLIDRFAVLEFWLCLTESERRSLIGRDKELAQWKLTQHYEREGCSCFDCLPKRSAIQSKLDSHYENFADDVEEFVQRYNERVDNSENSNDVRLRPKVDGPPVTRGSAQTAMEDQLMVFPAGESSSSTNLHHGFRTLGPAFTLRSDVNTVANDLLFNDDASTLSILAEAMTGISMHRNNGHTLSTHSSPKWPQDGRNLKNRQAFSIFATQMLEQRALQAYQKAEARKESLRRFHSTLDPRAPRFLIQSLTVEITVFEPGDIEIDYTVPANTGGAFCDLLCGRHLKLGKVALKRLRSDMSGSSRLPLFLGEIRVWQRLSHPNLLPFLGVLFDEHVSLVSPFVDNGSLPVYLAKHPNTDRRKFVRELASALAYLHGQGVVHGDLKGANVLVSADVSILLCDFGLAKMVDTNTSTSRAGLGTLRWQAPELMGGASKNFQTDVYAFGLTVYEILSGRVPFDHITCAGPIVHEVLVYGNRPPKEPASSPFGQSYEHFWAIATRCWSQDPDHRPAMTEVVAEVDEGVADQPDPMLPPQGISYILYLLANAIAYVLVRLIS